MKVEGGALLVVDIGNSQVTFAIVRSNDIVGDDSLDRLDLSTQAFKSELAENRERLSSFLKSHSAENILLVSVVPDVASLVTQLLKELIPSAKFHALTHSDVPLKSEYKPSSALGLDRLVSAYAAFAEFGAQHSNLLIIDFGTATTYNAVSCEGQFLGGAITLGVGATLEALHARTAQLPKESLEFPESVLGQSTSESIRSGVLFGAVASAKGMIAQFEKDLASKGELLVIATGGHAKLLAPHISRIDMVRPTLLLEGLVKLAKKVF